MLDARLRLIVVLGLVGCSAAAPTPYLRAPMGAGTGNAISRAVQVGGGPAWNSDPGAVPALSVQGRIRWIRQRAGDARPFLEAGTSLKTLSLGVHVAGGLVVADKASVALDLEAGLLYVGASLPVGVHLGRVATLYAAPGYVLPLDFMNSIRRIDYLRLPVGFEVYLAPQLSLTLETGYTLRHDRPMQLGSGYVVANTNAYVGIALQYVR